MRDQKVRLRQDTSLKVPIAELIAEARANGLSVQRLTGYGKVLDARLLAVEGRICQIIRTRQVANSQYPKAAHAALYLPRREFADFLIYVAFPSTGDPTFYVVPRGVMAKDTAWSLEALEKYRDAWHALKQPVTSDLTERRFTVVNWQLQAIIDAAKDVGLEVTLVGLKKRTPWPLYLQRRVLVGGRKCAVYCCSRLSPDPTSPQYNYVFLRIPTNKWAEFQLCLVQDGPNGREIYVIPRGAFQKQTTASLDNPAFRSYKSNWKLLSAPIDELARITPIEWRPPKVARPTPKLPEPLEKTMHEAQSQGLSVQVVKQRDANGYPRNKCLYISRKPCQILKTLLLGSGKHKGRFVHLNGEAPEDWAEIVVFFVRSEIVSEAPTFYVVPR